MHGAGSNIITINGQTYTLDQVKSTYNHFNFISLTAIFFNYSDAQAQTFLLQNFVGGKFKSRDIDKNIQCAQAGVLRMFASSTYIDVSQNVQQNSIVLSFPERLVTTTGTVIIPNFVKTTFDSNLYDNV
jgi:hypothetical protein